MHQRCPLIGKNTVETLNIKSQSLRICHKANKLYINGKYTAISRESRLLKFFHDFEFCLEKIRAEKCSGTLITISIRRKFLLGI